MGERGREGAASSLVHTESSSVFSIVFVLLRINGCNCFGIMRNNDNAIQILPADHAK